MTQMTDAEKIKKAIALAVQHGGHDEVHHKAWTIDQMVRILTGCPTVPQKGTDARGKEYTYDVLGESKEYRKLVRDARAGENGPETYDWDVGIPP